MKKSLLASALVASIAAGGMGVTEKAEAHATSIGYENGGAPGTVNIWLGTYNHGATSHHLEGSMNLVGVNGNTYASTTVAFTLGAGVGPSGDFDGLGANPATSKPAGLVDGTTNFFAPCSTGSSAPLLGTDPNCYGGVDHWQGAVFTGLTAGDYQFTWTPIANPTQEWSVLNSNMNGIFTLGGVVVNPGTSVSEPGTLALLGLGLAGLSFVRRKKQK